MANTPDKRALLPPLPFPPLSTAAGGKGIKRVTLSFSPRSSSSFSSSSKSGKCSLTPFSAKSFLSPFRWEENHVANYGYRKKEIGEGEYGGKIKMRRRISRDRIQTLAGEGEGARLPDHCPPGLRGERWWPLDKERTDSALSSDR